jgi:hypothetical protein
MGVAQKVREFLQSPKYFGFGILALIVAAYAAAGVTSLGLAFMLLGLAWSILVLEVGFCKWTVKAKRYRPSIILLAGFLCAMAVIWIANDIGTRKKQDVKQPEIKKETPPFAVEIEHRIFTVPGPYGTGFWFGTFLFIKCSLEPTGAAIFLRITNTGQQKEMITAYSINGLTKIPVPHGRMFIILPKGKITSGFTPHTIDWGAPAGLGALVDFPVDDADASKAIPVTGDFLDYKIGEGHFLEPDEPVRGWVFFEYRSGHTVIPANLTIKITDQFQHSFTYPIPDQIGDPEGDLLPRRVEEGPLEDLSRCKIVR